VGAERSAPVSTEEIQMATNLLATATLKTISNKDLGKILNDGGGLRGRVRRTRAGNIVIQFEYKYRSNKKYRTAKVEQWPNVSLAEIRKMHRAMKSDLSKGIDPIDSRKSEKLETQLEQAQQIANHNQELARIAAEEATQRTFADALKKWKRLELARRKDGGAEVIRAFQKDVYPTLENVALVDIKRTMLMDIFDQIVERGSSVMANHLFGDLRQFFDFAVTREWIESNPLNGISKDKVGRPPKERERYLTEDEIIKLKQQIEKANLLQTTEIAIWIMLSTCCRVGEISRAQWEQIDLENREWYIPAGNSKNAKPHTILLSDFSKQQFESLQALTGESKWCLPTRGGGNHVCLKSIAKQIKDRVRSDPFSKRTKAMGTLRLPGGDWTPHDLRRTGATMMGELGVMGEVIERCLNHVEQNKLKRTYQRQELKPQQREAWQLLGERLALLQSADISGNVVIGRFTKRA